MKPIAIRWNTGSVWAPHSPIFPGDKTTAREEELRKQGWTRQFTTEEPRLSESVELYKSLGFEVHLEPATKEEIQGDCGVCFNGREDQYKTIYTRKNEDSN